MKGWPAVLVEHTVALSHTRCGHPTIHSAHHTAETFCLTGGESTDDIACSASSTRSFHEVKQPHFTQVNVLTALRFVTHSAASLDTSTDIAVGERFGAPLQIALREWTCRSTRST